MSGTLGDVRAIADDLTRRTGRDTAVIDDAERPVPLHVRVVGRADARAAGGARRGRSGADLRRALHAGLRAGAGPVAAVGEAVHARGTRRHRGHARRVSLHRRLRQHALQARTGRRRRAPRRDAAALPAPRRAARADRPAEGDLRHRHARGRHQRPDPHGGLHEPGEVRRQPPSAPEGPRVPSDRRARRPRRVRHVRACRRAGARSRDRAHARAGEGGRRSEEAHARSRPRSRPTAW